MDMGEYYKSCGSISGTVVSERSIVFVAVKGPPIIASLTEIERFSRKLSLNVISLPSPDSNVSIKNSKGTELSRSSARIRPGLVNYTAYGVNVQIKGYKMDIVIEHAEIEWFGEIIVIVSNKLGAGKYRLMVKKKSWNKAQFLFAKRKWKVMELIKEDPTPNQLCCALQNNKFGDK
ncbi:uncharacterized protein LOC134277739, partial [Saccostrea cucullata]|uniref:uncharacterized protein LOC134277739 n=1 Tax=Saccostrea cuccullata TaxID=36930 RepID=UPI002ED12694